MDARRIIEEILERMHEDAVSLYYTVVVPSTFHVYLPPGDLISLKPAENLFRQDAVRLLETELDALNRDAKPRFRIPFIDDPEEVREFVRNGDWTIQLHENTDEEGAGDVMIRSQIPVPAGSGSEYAGKPTERVTRIGADGTKTSRAAVAPTPQAQRPVWGTLEYRTPSGVKTFHLDRDKIKIGRGGNGRWPDCKLEDVPKDVSREHLQIRRDPLTGRVYLKDLSLYGTTVDGVAVPCGVERHGNEEIDRNIEVELPGGAVIGLAGVLEISFQPVS